MNGKPDILYDAALFYDEHLNNKEFHLKAKRKGEFIEFDILFREEHFKHLIGFHKLIDLPEHRDKSGIILEAILNQRIDSDYISLSAHYSEIVDRIDNFKELKNCLYTDELMLRRINEYSFNTIQADFLMTKELDFGIVELFLKENGPALAVPVTFFTADKNKYLAHTSKWQIVEMKELDKAENNSTLTPHSSSNNQKHLTEQELLVANKKIRYDGADPNELIDASFTVDNEEYKIKELELLRGKTKDMALLERTSDGTLFQDNDFASQSPLKLNLSPADKSNHLVAPLAAASKTSSK